MAQHCLLNKVARTNTHYQVGLHITLKPVRWFREQIKTLGSEGVPGETGGRGRGWVWGRRIKLDSKVSKKPWPGEGLVAILLCLSLVCHMKFHRLGGLND